MLEGNKIPYNRVINLFYKRKIYEHIIKNVFSGSFWATELYMLSFFYLLYFPDLQQERVTLIFFKKLL